MALLLSWLIGFRLRARSAAAYAGRKAFFLTTRKDGDLGFYLAACSRFSIIWDPFNIPTLHQNLSAVQYPSWVLTAVPILLVLRGHGENRRKFRCMFGCPTPWKAADARFRFDPRGHDGGGRRLYGGPRLFSI